MSHRPLTSQPIRKAVRAALVGSLVTGCLIFGSSAHAALTFNFDYTNSGALYDGAVGQQRRDAIATAGTMFSNYFGGLFSNMGTVTLAVEGSFQGCAMGCTLAYAGSERTFSNGQGFGNGEVVRNILVNGVDLNGAANDGVVGVNWGAPWELDPNVSVAAQNTGNFDLYAALFHELTHALGFASVMQENGSDGTSQGGGTAGGINYAGFWNKFDDFKTNCAGTDLINHANGLTNQPTYDNAKTSAMCFNGANAVAANGGNAVALYAPGTYSAGSTGSHVDESGNNIGAMMKFDRDPNKDEARTYNAIEIGMLMDIGYTRAVVAGVPEPTTALLVLAALGGLGLARRKA